jgi:hypothetical protein
LEKRAGLILSPKTRNRFLQIQLELLGLGAPSALYAERDSTRRAPATPFRMRSFALPVALGENLSMPFPQLSDAEVQQAIPEVTSVRYLALQRYSRL